MKAIIFILILFFSISLYSQQYDEDSYGYTWTYIFEAKNKLQAKKIIRRYKLANIGQSYYKDNGKYYIELSYYDDHLEKFWGKFYCIPDRLIKRLKLIEVITYDGKNPIDIGGGYLTF